MQVEWGEACPTQFNHGDLHMDTSKDFLAFCSIGTGSSWGYGETPAEAVFNCIVSLKDWAGYFKLSEEEIIVPVYNVSAYTGFVADYKGVYGSSGEEEETNLHRGSL